MVANPDFLSKKKFLDNRNLKHDPTINFSSHITRKSTHLNRRNSSKFPGKYL